MTRLPRLTGKEAVRALQRIGFDVIRTRGSHVFLKHPDGRVTTVPVHSRETLPSGCLDRKSTRLNSSHQIISYAVFCLKKKKAITQNSMLIEFFYRAIHQ